MDIITKYIIDCIVEHFDNRFRECECDLRVLIESVINKYYDEYSMGYLIDELVNAIVDWMELYSGEQYHIDDRTFNAKGRRLEYLLRYQFCMILDKYPEIYKEIIKK